MIEGFSKNDIDLVCKLAERKHADILFIYTINCFQ